MRTTNSAAALDPAVVLFGSTRRRVLGWLLGHADTAYYLRELARHTGGAIGALQRELEQLTAAGLVRREVRGKQVYFQANREAPIFPELHGVFAKTVLARPTPAEHLVKNAPEAEIEPRASRTAKHRARTRRPAMRRATRRRSGED